MDKSIRQRWQNGEVTFGAWCMMPGAMGVEIIGRQGFDWVLIDMQHGCIGYNEALDMIRALDQTSSIPIVRVPWNEPGIIGRVLDAGAAGVLVPMIETAQDARDAVAACLYPPQGRRSFGPIRASLRDGTAYASHANDRIAVILMIETAEALEAVENIAAVEGVHALFVGPYDLSMSLGLPPGDNDGKPEFDRAISAVLGACDRQGLAGAVLSNPTVAPLRVEQGFQMISISNDAVALSGVTKNEMEEAKRLVEAGS